MHLGAKQMIDSYKLIKMTRYLPPERIQDVDLWVQSTDAAQLIPKAQKNGFAEKRHMHWRDERDVSLSQPLAEIAILG